MKSKLPIRGLFGAACTLAGVSLADVARGQAVGAGCCAVPTPVVAAPVVAACAPPPPPAPIAVAQTKMVQRSYLAPVTTMQTRTALEPVTTYHTSTYLEPVTTVRTSAYYDPCSCGYKAVSTPVTSYVPRTTVSPVTTMVTRNYQVPVTSYETRVVSEPVTEIQYYYPATPVVAAPACPAPVAAVTPVAATTGSHYWTPAPVVPAVAATPAVAAPTVVPATPAVPQAQQPQGNVIERNYGAPAAANNDQGTTLIERFFQNGELKEENKRYFAPGTAVPPPRTQEEFKTPEQPGSTYYRSNPPRLLSPIPVGGQPGNQNGSVRTASWDQIYRDAVGR